MVFLKGPALASLFFILYVSKLFTIVERHLPEVQAYADDIQLYTAFKPDSAHAANANATVQDCITDIWKWMLMQAGA